MMNSRLYSIFTNKNRLIYLASVASYNLKPLEIITSSGTRAEGVDIILIFNMYRLCTKDLDNVFNMIQSRDPDTQKLAIGILRSNNCIIYEKGT